MKKFLVVVLMLILSVTTAYADFEKATAKVNIENKVMGGEKDCTFLVSPMGDSPELENPEITISGSGKEVITLDFSEPRDYFYKVTQITEEEEGWTIDRSVYIIGVSVTTNEQNVLQSTVWIENENNKKIDELVYENSFEETTVPEKPEKPEEEKPEKPEKPNTGDQTDTYFWITLMGLSSAGILGFLLKKDRNSL